jgi:nucleotide-binding universal stress UspA family protein
VREHTKTALFGLLEAREDGIWGRAHLLKGRPANLIPKLAEKEKVDLIVMGTVCRTGVPGVFMGNTAESILQQVESSVLTIKPDGFVTPVAA